MRLLNVVAVVVCIVQLTGCDRFKVNTAGVEAGDEATRFQRRNRSASGGGDSPIMVAGGSVSLLTSTTWSVVSGTAFSSTTDASIISFERVQPFAAGMPLVTEVDSIGVPWQLEIFVRGKDDTKPSVLGMVVCNVLNASNNGCNISTGTFSATSVSIFSPYFYANAAPDDNGTKIKRYQSPPSTCNVAAGELCEHIHHLVLSFQGGPVLKYACPGGACRVYIGPRG